MRATAIYVRQSVERSDSISLETQEALCRTAASPDADIRLYADRGFSGKNTDRPGLKALLSDIESGNIGAVIVYKLDRISRNLSDFTRLLDFFRAHRVEFLSRTECFETATPMGQAMQSLLMVFAQLERETISGRVRDASLERAKLGFDTGGTPPFGFRKIPTTISGKRTQMLEADENAALVEEAFRRYFSATGSLSAIAADWNRRGIRTARGGDWQAESVRRMLRNPVYAQADGDVYTYFSRNGAWICVPEPLPPAHGIYLYTDRREAVPKSLSLHGVYAICAPHSGLIPSALWLGCQEKLSRCRKRRTLGTARSFPYSGLLFCKRCGGAVTTVSGRSREYLCCSGKKRGRCGGIGAVWRKEDANALLDAALSSRLGTLSRCRRDAAPDSATLDALGAARLRKAALEQSLTDLEAVDIPAVASAITRLTKRLEQLEAVLRTSDKAAKTYDFPPFLTCTPETQKSIARCLISKIIVEEDSLNLYWN